MEFIYNIIKAVFAAIMSAVVTVTGFFGSLSGRFADKPEIPAMAPGTITAGDIGEAVDTQPILIDEDYTAENRESGQSAITEIYSQSFDSFSRDLPSGYTAAENKVYKAVDFTYADADTIKNNLTGVSITGVKKALTTLTEDGYIQKNASSDTYKRLRENIYVQGAAASGEFNYILAEGTNIKGLYNGSSYSSTILTKLSADGELIKSVEISNYSNEIHYTGIAATDSGIAVCGYSPIPELTGTNYAFIEKYDSDLNKIWTKKIYGESSDYLHCIASTSDGGFVAGGKTNSTTHDFDGIPDYGYSTAVLMKFNSDGERIWCRYLGGSGVASVVDVDTDSSGNIFADISSSCNDGDFAGFSGKIANNIDNVIIRYDNDGLMKWKCVLSTNGRDYFDCVAADGNGGCLAGGNFTYNSSGLVVTSGTLSGLFVSGGSDIVIASIGTYGNLAKARLLKGTANDYLCDIVKLGSGWLLAGYSASEDGEFAYPDGIYNQGDYDAFAEVIDNSLAKIEMISFGGEERDVATAALASGNSFTVFGDIDTVAGETVTSEYFAKGYTVA